VAFLDGEDDRFLRREVIVDGRMDEPDIGADIPRRGRRVSQCRQALECGGEKFLAPRHVFLLAWRHRIPLWFGRSLIAVSALDQSARSMPITQSGRSEKFIDREEMQNMPATAAIDVSVRPMPIEIAQRYGRLPEYRHI